MGVLALNKKKYIQVLNKKLNGMLTWEAQQRWLLQLCWMIEALWVLLNGWSLGVEQ